MSFLWAQEIDTIPNYEVPTVQIGGVRPLGASSAEGSVEQLSREGFFVPVYRSVPFAQEVVYQGLLPQQTQVVIDGMRVIPACVDRMDPVLTFVESAALEGANWSARQNWGVTPTLNATLLSPGGSQRNQLLLRVADNYHRFFGSVRSSGTSGRWRYALAFTARKGADYRSGAWVSASQAGTHAFGRDSTWQIPSLTKLNSYAALSYTLSSHHQIELRYLGDLFYNVAYPGLIMDTRHSAFHLPSLSYQWQDRLHIRVYVNTVFHDMTDEGRSEQEIRTRGIMPGMYMPMRGRTQSLGSTMELTWLHRGPWQVLQRSEYSRHTAWGDMDMRPLHSGALMYLLNLADIRFQQTTHLLEARYNRKDWQVNTLLTGSLFDYKVGDTLNFLPLSLYQELYGDTSYVERRFSTYQATINGAYRFPHQPLSVRSMISYGTRAPSHTELYGYYLYVPMDNSIQMGNSALRPERLLRAELSFSYHTGPQQIELSGFFNQIRDYIAPVTFLTPFSTGNATTQAWRFLRNTGSAFTIGGTLMLAYEERWLVLRGQFGYTYGWHISYGEPLPWIYPLYGRLTGVLPYRRHKLGIEAFWAAGQRQLSRRIYPEDYTPSYGLLHVRYEVTAVGYANSNSNTHETKKHRAFYRVVLTAAVENLLNTYGCDHLSVGNMPFLGRTLSVGVRLDW